MNHKSLILAALLLPSLLHSTSKEEQIKYFKDQIDIVERNMTILNEELTYEAFLAFMAGSKDEANSKSIVKEIRRLQKKLICLKKQLSKLGITHE